MNIFKKYFQKNLKKLRKYISICALYNRFDYIDTAINSKKIIEQFTLDEIKIIKNATNQMKYRHKKIRSFNKFFNKLLRLIDEDNSLHLFY